MVTNGEFFINSKKTTFNAGLIPWQNRQVEQNSNSSLIETNNQNTNAIGDNCSLEEWSEIWSDVNAEYEGEGE